VTKQLRTLVNTGEAAITSIVATVHVDGKDVPRIQHEDVRLMVQRHYDAGKISGYERVSNGTFWTYRPVAVSAVDPDPDPTDPTAAAGALYDGTSTI
jgi:hypothetical protein